MKATAPAPEPKDPYEPITKSPPRRPPSAVYGHGSWWERHRRAAPSTTLHEPRRGLLRRGVLDRRGRQGHATLPTLTTLAYAAGRSPAVEQSKGCVDDT